MHVLFITSWYPDEARPTRGIFFREQARALQRANNKVGVVTAIATRNIEPPDRIYNEYDIPVYFGYLRAYLFPLSAFNHLLMTEKLLHLARAYERDCGRPDIIHVQSTVAAGSAALTYSTERSIPFVITEHSSLFIQRSILPPKKALLKQVFKGAAGIAVVSPSLGRALEREMAPHAQSWSWIPNMVDPFFRPGRSQGSKAFRFLTVGQLVQAKGHMDLLAAFADAFRGEDGVVLAIGGEGKMRDALQRASVSLGIADQIEFLGFLTRDQVRAEMRKCDAFVLPSHFETFGVVLIEAMACGKPCIATRCGGPECIIDEETGILVEPQNSKVLSHALTRMKSDVSEYDSRLIREKCVARFGAQKLVERLENFYSIALRDGTVHRKEL